MADPLFGFAFPFRIARGGVARSSSFEKLQDDVRHLLSTRLGERVMLRGYGGGVHHRLQDPNAGTLRALVKHEIEEALRVYLPDIRLVSPIQIRSVEEELRISFEYVADPSDVVRSLELQIP